MPELHSWALPKWQSLQKNPDVYKKDIIYKMWTDLKILKNKMLESIFIEIINPNKKRTSLHGSHNESNDNFVSDLSKKLLQEK